MSIRRIVIGVLLLTALLALLPLEGTLARELIVAPKAGTILLLVELALVHAVGAFGVWWLLHPRRIR